jgi:hypothetical protein
VAGVPRVIALSELLSRSAICSGEPFFLPAVTAFALPSSVRDWTDLDSYHDDAIDNHFGEVLPFREAIGTLKAARSSGIQPSSKTTSMHNICNMLIEVDGDSARCETYVIVIVRIPQDQHAIDWMHAGRYVDRFERRSGEWRIAYRTVVYDLERFDEVSPAPDGLSQARYLDNAVRGKRGLADFSYEILKG